jgi:flagellar hook-basal body complex protein FliE
MSVDRVIALRAQILERNAALSRAPSRRRRRPRRPRASRRASSIRSRTRSRSVNQAQAKAGALSESYERGETIDIAKVMLARQQASVGFEATLQVRNKLLSAYKDIMSMPV